MYVRFMQNTHKHAYVHTCMHTVHVHVLNLVMELAVDSVSLVIDQFESVGTVSVHVPKPVRDPTVTEQE